jgi:asparagine synthase (glutamine-hydrolysing)
MCGLTGTLGPGEAAEREATVERMLETLRHRGPDDAGIWADPDAGIALAFRRLAIIDVSELGHQPMRSETGRYLVVFNGELYNFRELRAELEAAGHRFRGGSDTEVLLAAFTRWGFPDALPRLDGMYAFALWDREERALHLVRDRLGEKPLYYGWAGRTFLFGSELKALRAHPHFEAEVDRDALASFLRHKQIPSPWSIYRGVRKLPPASSLTLRDPSPGAMPEPVAYWSYREVAERGASAPFPGSVPEALDHLDELLRSAVRRRMHADVPLGAFLSGGVDSSTVVAMMQAQSERPVRTFTIGLAEVGYDESPYAREVAARLGTDHTDLLVTPAEAIDLIPRLPHVYDEPFADSSQIPTMLVSELAVRDVTVCLSGDGGDEVFGGYNTHIYVDRLWRGLRHVPVDVRRVGAGALRRLSGPAMDRALRRATFLSPEAGQRPADKLRKLADVIALDGPEAMYLRLGSHWTDPASIVIGAGMSIAPEGNGASWPSLPDVTSRMMVLDATRYLPDDILAKVDRASMAASLEVRVPYLDPELIAFAWRLPLSMKIRGGEGKWALRRVLDRYLPSELFDRPKAGFGIPIGSWLRGPLRPWAEELLDPTRLRREGFLRPEPIRERWEEHLAGRRDRQFVLWDVLMFQAWLEATPAEAAAGATGRIRA